ncbi:PREDICTED: tubulin--tyrosine ligase-like protein 12 [Nicrophorus vespilloides]|uniref:Tubulin--tyrosine ligase-like protein 12 n=1 Tax=Nicrophorus vespilloides TaxID=110193 RepID=A0ABM1M1W1_NICVS|nr:PREDICTED: tubulin--tyrosine ligase-like protein 12 [Nicrophorus vespilloides]
MSKMKEDVDDYEYFLRLHRNQLVASQVPEKYWRTVFSKTNAQILDAGLVFTLLRIDYDDDDDIGDGQRRPVFQVMTSEGIRADDPAHIYLVDHAWTFRPEFARRQLLAVDKLRERMAALMGLQDDDDGDGSKETLVRRLYAELWRYANCYSIENADSVEERMPVWYVMDELGCGIGHSDDANFRMVPFICSNSVDDDDDAGDEPTKSAATAYSLLFPVRDVECGEQVTRDYAEGLVGDARDVCLLPWVANDTFVDRDHQHRQLDPDYFLGGHVKETLPMLSERASHDDDDVVSSRRKAPHRVYTEYEYVAKYLTDERFEIVGSVDEADILWMTTHFKHFEELSLTAPWKFVNQFPFEYVLTIKDLLPVTCRRMVGDHIVEDLSGSPSWLPVTYNLKVEIDRFVSYYKKREAAGLDNHWIIKPFNLARGLDTHITDDLNFIIRLRSSGAKIVQKYIERPVLFDRQQDVGGRVKFDIRYVVLLKKSRNPLEAYVYSKFFLRFANRPFALDNLDVYEQHFTVMNYTEGGAHLKHMLCEEFKLEWAKQYPEQPWSEIEKRIFAMLREVFECATMEPPPCGISESPQSRALYAADIMLVDVPSEKTTTTRLSSHFQPQLLEINWTPDCKRACEYYPDFYNDIFRLLFLDIENEAVLRKL